jgi:hypothetical protein
VGPSGVQRGNPTLACSGALWPRVNPTVLGLPAASHRPRPSPRSAGAMQIAATVLYHRPVVVRRLVAEGEPFICTESRFEPLLLGLQARRGAARRRGGAAARPRVSFTCNQAGLPSPPMAIFASGLKPCASAAPACRKPGYTHSGSPPCSSWPCAVVTAVV